MAILKDVAERLKAAVRPQRLAETALRLIAIPSRTGEAGGALDELASMLRGEGFDVERHAAGHAQAPAVAARWDSGRPGRCLQWDGHLDTVHLPFVPPASLDGKLTGSGAADMKSGVAAAVEALRLVRETQAILGGSILLTAHDLHEAPWGFGQQLDAMIRSGLHGDAVLIPEPLSDRLPVIGRGAATWKAAIRRSGAPVHEVMRPADQPDVIAAGAAMVGRLAALDRKLAERSDPLAGSESVFVGQIHGGEIYNQFPRECLLEGTRRWLPGTERAQVQLQFEELAAQLDRDAGTSTAIEFRFIRDAFFLDAGCPAAAAFQDARTALEGEPMAHGPKPFVDDGNSFWGLAKIPAITHGPKAGGQHTLEEWVSAGDLVRVALQYALTAAAYCKAP